MAKGNSVHSYVQVVMLSGAIVSAGFAVGHAAGDREDGENRIIGYEGFLSQDALPVTRQGVPAEFWLYTSRDGVEHVWHSGETTTIDVVDGRFAVALGDTGQDPLGDSVWQQSRLFLEVSVEGVPLTGRQELLVTPFAARAVPGKTFYADEVNMTSGGTLRAGGRLHLESEEIAYVLARDRTIIGKEWGSSGVLDVQASLNVGTVGNADVFNVYGGDHAYMQWFPDRGDRKGRIGYLSAGTQTLSVVSEGGELELRGSRVRIDGDGLVVAGRYFCPRRLVRCRGGEEHDADHMTWVDNESECTGADYVVEGAVYVLMEC